MKMLPNPSDQLFFSGMTIALAGTFSIPQAELKQLIKVNGGRINTNVTQEVTHVVSTFADSTKATSRIALALKYGKPLIDEQFIHDCASGRCSTFSLEKYILKPDPKILENYNYYRGGSRKLNTPTLDNSGDVNMNPFKRHKKRELKKMCGKRPRNHIGRGGGHQHQHLHNHSHNHQGHVQGRSDNRKISIFAAGSPHLHHHSPIQLASSPKRSRRSNRNMDEVRCEICGVMNPMNYSECSKCYVTYCARCSSTYKEGTFGTCTGCREFCQHCKPRLCKACGEVAGCKDCMYECDGSPKCTPSVRTAQTNSKYAQTADISAATNAL